uniref:Uncharacterized protein n=1 Tax=Ananas comosus var. bracteatus TaxID=296719 RepID=A0A6V7P1P0_ANACO|nr:unnamed protein product [Ananas comosus var. bracteatus]
MWARLRSASKREKGREKQETIDHKSFNVNEEYINTLRTQSNAEFFAKTHLFISDPSIHTSSKPDLIIGALLEPEQDVISSTLESLIFPSAISDLKLLLTNYFDISAKASKFCTQLLRNINKYHSNHQSIEEVLETISKSKSLELDSIALLANPVSNPNQADFKLIQDRCSLILHRLKSRRKKVATRIKLIKCMKKLLGFCFTLACGLVALKKISNLKYFKTEFLKKMWEQLDVVAKGTYILHCDFDTMSRLVAWIHDEFEHNNMIIRHCMERKDNKCHVQGVVKEIKNSRCGIIRKVEELEEHVCLCLATINRARVLVMKEISPP